MKLSFPANPKVVKTKVQQIPIEISDVLMFHSSQEGEKRSRLRRLLEKAHDYEDDPEIHVVFKAVSHVEKNARSENGNAAYLHIYICIYIYTYIHTFMLRYIYIWNGMECNAL